MRRIFRPSTFLRRPETVMTDSFLKLFEAFRPEGSSRSSRRTAQVHVYRLLTLLGTVLLPGFGILYKTSSLDVFDPIWVRPTTESRLESLLQSIEIPGRSLE